MAWSRSLVIAVDVVVVLWLAAMLLLGGLAKAEIDRLAATADSMVAVAQQESEIASALGPLSAIPVAGDRIAAAQQQLTQASIRTQRDADVTAASLHQLGNLAFYLVALMAIFPVAVIYLPMRLMRRGAARFARGRAAAA